MNLPNFSLEPLFEKISAMTHRQRVLISVTAYLLPILIWGYFSVYPQYNQIQELREGLAQLQLKIDKASAEAKKIHLYRKEMAEAEAEFLLARSALPDKEEIPSLLTGITQSGKMVGLEFFLFEPKSEIRKDFYAEIPVSITVSGEYHHVAMFFDYVSNLSRIVNIRDIKMIPRKESGQLITTCTAVTYKFMEETPPAPPKSGKTKKSGGAA